MNFRFFVQSKKQIESLIKRQIIEDEFISTKDLEWMRFQININMNNIGFGSE